MRKTYFGVYDNKGADQPALPRSLISPFVICLSESLLNSLALLNRKFNTSQISHRVRIGTWQMCLRMVNFDNFGGLKSVLKFYIFFSF